MSKWTELMIAALAGETPAPALRGVNLAQWALESGWGTSKLATEHNNFAGLKWRPEMAGVATKVNYQAHDGPADYCAFASPADFVRGYWTFIGRSVYNGWRDHKEDPEAYVRFLAGKGYAGDPNYAAKVIALLARMEVLVRAFDAIAQGAGGAPASAAPAPAAPAGPAGDAPEAPEDNRPNRAEIGEQVADVIPAAEEPRFKTLGQVRHKFRGARPAGLEGAIIHFDAGRTRPVNSPDDPEWGAIKTLEYAQTQGFAYATVSRGGTIYLPTNMDWKQWGSHAGESTCPRTGRNWVSQFYVGFEVNSPGIVYPTADPDLYVPWFEAVRDSKGNVVLDSAGRARIAKPNGEIYRKSQVAIVTANQANLRKGVYVPYTRQQIQALVGVMLWLKRTYATFRLDSVFGHDEVAPSRKTDPGGCLIHPAGSPAGPCTMAKFREHLAAEWERQKLLVG